MESITVKTSAGKSGSFDDYGNFIPGEAPTEYVIDHVVVSPAGSPMSPSDDSIMEQDIFTGSSKKLIVIVPAGYEIPEGTEVEIRGLTYIAQFNSWDYSYQRGAWLSTHQPKSVLTVERAEA